jgi:uncharacterized protein YggE
MQKQIYFKRLAATIAIALTTTMVDQAIAAPASSSTRETRVAQLFYPPASSPQVIAVTGQGHATLPADTARLDLVMTNRPPYDESPFIPDRTQPPKPQPKPEPITAAALAPIVKALKAAGVPDTKIKVKINPLERRRYSYGNNTSISVDLEKPTQERIGQLVDVVNTTLRQQGDRPKIFLDEAYVQYIVTNCAAVEDAAYLAAMNDAKLRATALAKAIGVQLADTPSVAELPFLGRFYSPCSQELDIIGAAFRRPNAPYNPATPAAVEVYREIAVTYRITGK